MTLSQNSPNAVLDKSQKRQFYGVTPYSGERFIQPEYTSKDHPSVPACFTTYQAESFELLDKQHESSGKHFGTQ